MIKGTFRTSTLPWSICLFDTTRWGFGQLNIICGFNFYFFLYELCYFNDTRCILSYHIWLVDVSFWEQNIKLNSLVSSSGVSPIVPVPCKVPRMRYRETFWLWHCIYVFTLGTRFTGSPCLSIGLSRGGLFISLFCFWLCNSDDEMVKEGILFSFKTRILWYLAQEVTFRLIEIRIRSQPSVFREKELNIPNAWGRHKLIRAQSWWNHSIFVSFKS